MIFRLLARSVLARLLQSAFHYGWATHKESGDENPWMCPHEVEMLLRESWKGFLKRPSIRA